MGYGPQVVKILFLNVQILDGNLYILNQIGWQIISIYFHLKLKKKTCTYFLGVRKAFFDKALKIVIISSTRLMVG